MLLILKTGTIWLSFVILAVLNGIIREKILTEYLGEGVALALSGIMLSALIFLTTYLLLPAMGALQASQYRRIGFIWLLLTLAFEFGFGHFVMATPWPNLLAAYKIWEGNLWILVLATTMVAPYLSAKFRGLL